MVNMIVQDYNITFTVGLYNPHTHTYITPLTRHWLASRSGIQSLQEETTKPAAGPVQVQTLTLTLCLIHTKTDC